MHFFEWPKTIFKTAFPRWSLKKDWSHVKLLSGGMSLFTAVLFWNRISRHLDFGHWIPMLLYIFAPLRFRWKCCTLTQLHLFGPGSSKTKSNSSCMWPDICCECCIHLEIKKQLTVRRALMSIYLLHQALHLKGQCTSQTYTSHSHMQTHQIISESLKFVFHKMSN